MEVRRDVAQLSAPRLSELRLSRLLAAAGDPDARTLLARLLSDPWQVQGSAEYYAHDLDDDVESIVVPRCLAELRHAGWVHQRVAPGGLLSRLRRDDLTLRYPDVMGSLREPAHLVPYTDSAWILHRLRALSSKA
ncbi:MAG: hypothetical protein ACRDO7_05415 [Nocardioidaceae bacterium]